MKVKLQSAKINAGCAEQRSRKGNPKGKNEEPYFQESLRKIKNLRPFSPECETPGWIASPVCAPSFIRHISDQIAISFLLLFRTRFPKTCRHL
jgi:hypothetical protein